MRSVRRIGSISGSAGLSGYAVRPRIAASELAAADHGYSLVAVDPAPQIEWAGPIGSRPFAPFLAHLIATERQMPQTRAHRRGSQDEATAAYCPKLGTSSFRTARVMRRCA